MPDGAGAGAGMGGGAGGATVTGGGDTLGGAPSVRGSGSFNSCVIVANAALTEKSRRTSPKLDSVSVASVPVSRDAYQNSGPVKSHFVHWPYPSLTMADWPASLTA